MNTQIRSSSSPIKIPMIIIGPSILYSGIIENNTFTIFRRLGDKIVNDYTVNHDK